MVHILGIRHHGVGSAKNVLEMLKRLQPDMILVEGAPELDGITQWIGNKDLKPPIAVLGYNQDNAKQAVFYPFAEFSPEWQAIAYANNNGIPCRMMDLPLSINFVQAASTPAASTPQPLSPPQPPQGGETDRCMDGETVGETDRCMDGETVGETDSPHVGETDSASPDPSRGEETDRSIDGETVGETDRCMDGETVGETDVASPDPSRGGETDEPTSEINEDDGLDDKAANISVSPLRGAEGVSYFAHLGGYTNSEAWWEEKFEQKYDKATAAEHFEAVMLMMRTLRESDMFSAERERDNQNDIREVYMRQILRKAQNDMYNNIVVVCGAWHAPALVELDKTAKEDAKILKTLPKTKIKVGVTLIPWTNERLSQESGYGAGITSPGWYEHLWKYPNDDGVRWLTKVAKLFRKAKIDVSTAHIIETYRLAEAVAALRNKGRIGLHEHQEAIQTVMCMGDAILLELVRKEMIVGNRFGKIPDEVPKMPLQADFETTAKKLKFAMSAERKDVELDLRKDLDLQRSVFLFRLQALNIHWATSAYSRSKGTFKEAWHLRWQPEMMINLIEKGIYGNSVEIAASNYVLAKANETQEIGEIAEFIQQAIPAELFATIETLLGKINELATISADIQQLMTAVVPLVDVSRYGNVRKTDLTTIYNLVESLITRIAIGLPNACYGIDEAASQIMFEHIRKVNDAVRLLENANLTEVWQRTLLVIVDKDGINTLITGCTCRLLFDAKVLDADATATRFGLALSSGNEATYSAGFIEGFLKGSGMILLYDHTLWNILYKWVVELPDTQFDELLPILRRTFSKFETAERRQLGEKAKQGTAASEAQNTFVKSEFFDTERAESLLPSVALLLGF